MLRSSDLFGCNSISKQDLSLLLMVLLRGCSHQICLLPGMTFHIVLCMNT